MHDANKYVDIINLKEDIARWYNSVPYIKLSNRFQQTDIFKILRVSRKEERHSKSIAWLLDPNGSHGLGDFPIRRFLQFLAINKNKSMNSDAEFPMDMETQFILGNYELKSNSPCTWI